MMDEEGEPVDLDVSNQTLTHVSDTPSTHSSVKTASIPQNKDEVLANPPESEPICPPGTKASVATSSAHIAPEDVPSDLSKEGSSVAENVNGDEKVQDTNPESCDAAISPRRLQQIAEAQEETLLDELEKEREGFERWMSAVCVVTFDNELGQTLEYCYPPNKLTHDDETNVCFMSFPDSNSAILGDTVYTFRMRTTNIKMLPSFLHLTPDMMASNSNNGDNSVDKGDKGLFVYGYVFSRQQKDSSYARGYFQKSVVILTPHPFIDLYHEMVRALGPLYFQYGRDIIEAGCHTVARWPPPSPGTCTELPLVGVVLEVLIPHYHSSHHHYHKHPSTSTASSHGSKSHQAKEKKKHNTSEVVRSSSLGELLDSLNEQRPGLFQEINMYSTFMNLLPCLWSLWELVISGEPILLVCSTPTQCSQAVLALTSMVAPLAFHGDFRPYFTIHDPEFKHITGLVDSQKEGNLILGVTNPIFLKVVTTWPNIVSIGRDNYAKKSLSMDSIMHMNTKKIDIISKMKPGKSLLHPNQHKHKNQSSNNNGADDNNSDTYKSRIYHRHKPCLLPNKAILKQLVPVHKTMGNPELVDVNNEILRHHFNELTEAFLVPFEKYFTFSYPLPKHVSPFVPLPALQPFTAASFLAECAKLAPTKIILVSHAKDIVTLYKRFIRSPHFRPWFDSRRERAVVQLQAMYRKAQYDANMALLMHGLRESQIIDFFLKIKDHVDIETQRGGPNCRMVCRLREHMSFVLSSVQPYLRKTLIDISTHV